MSELLKCVTDDVITAALHSDKGAEATLISWSLEDFTSQFDGATSVIKNVRIAYSLGGQSREVCYVLKVNQSRGEEANTFFGIIYAKECNFYKEVIPALNSVLEEIGCAPLSFPKCFYHILEKGKYLLLLENLKEQGYQMKDRALGIDAAHGTLVLKELAKLHAASVLLQLKTPDEDLVDRFGCLKKEWTKEFNLGGDFGTFVEGYLNIGVAMFEKIGNCERVIKWINKIKPNVWKMYNEQLIRNPPFAVITHGDCWINNLLFKYDTSNNPVEVKFLDLQGCRKASLATDLHHFLNLNLVGSERRPNLPSLLSTYHTAFDEVMKAGKSEVPFTLEELKQEYINRGFYGVLYAIMFLPNMVRRPEDVRDILDTKTGAKRSEKENVLKMVDDNPLLIPRIMSVIDEWIERGLIS